MAINSINGQNTYDPSKRIKAAFGNQEAINLHAEAVARMTQAMNSTAIRNRTEFVEENNDRDRISNMVKNISHTNPAEPQSNNVSKLQNNNNVNTVSMNAEDYIRFRGTALSVAYKNATEMYENESKFDTLLRNVSGFSTKTKTPATIEHIGRFAGKNVMSCILTNCLDTTFATNTDEKSTAKVIGIASAINILTSSALTSNNTKFKNVFDVQHMNTNEIKMINNVHFVQRVKYGVENTVASVVLPAVTKLAINKTASEDIKNNKVFKFATSFGVLSEVGKFALSGIRRLNEKKLREQMIKEISNVNLPNDPAEACQAYKTYAKYVSNKIINESIDDSLLGTVFGSFLGYSEIEYEKGGNVSTVKAISDYKKEAATKPVAAEVSVSETN